MSIAKIAVDVILVAILIGGVAFSILFTTNTSTWGTTTVLIWGFIGVIVVAAVLIALLKDAGLRIDME